MSRWASSSEPAAGKGRLSTEVASRVSLSKGLLDHSLPGAPTGWPISNGPARDHMRDWATRPPSEQPIIHFNISSGRRSETNEPLNSLLVVERDCKLTATTATYPGACLRFQVCPQLDDSKRVLTAKFPVSGLPSSIHSKTGSTRNVSTHPKYSACHSSIGRAWMASGRSSTSTSANLGDSLT